MDEIQAEISMLRLRLFPTCTFIYERQIFDDQRELRTKILSVGSVTCLSLISSWDLFAKEKNDVRDDDRINNWIISSSIYRIFTILNPLCHLDDYIYISFNYLDNIKMPFSFTQNGIDEGKGISKHVVSFFWGSLFVYKAMNHRSLLHEIPTIT